MAKKMGRPLNAARQRWQEPAAIGAVALTLAVALVPALLAAGSQMLAASSPLGLLANNRLWWLLLGSLRLSISVTALALASGIPLGVLFSRAEFPLKRLLLALHVGVVFLPPFLPALGWFHLFGRDGSLGGNASTRLLFSEFGVVMVLVGCFTPVVTVLTLLGLSGIDPSLEDAARIVARPWRTAWQILVPCAMPAIALSGIVVFVLAFSELGVPMFLRVDVYPTVVFTRLGGMDFAPGEAAVFVLPLVLMSLVVLWVERRVAGRRAIAALGSPLQPRAMLFRYQPWLFIAATLASAPSALPVFALLFSKSGWTGLLEVARWTADAPFNSLRAGLCAALGMSALAVVQGHAVARRSRIGLWLDGVTTLAFILPASILGVGIALAWNRPATNWLYASFGILVLGFFARYSAIATRVFAASVAQVPVSFEEAARSVGAGYFRRLALLVGLLRRGCFGAFAVALVLCLRDLETAALFYPPGGEPLTVRIFTLEANGPPAIVSALAGLQVVMTFAVVGTSWLLLRPRPTS
jgi:iron(III) transport system permease protein